MYRWSIVKDKRVSNTPWLIAKDLSFLPESCQRLGAVHLHDGEKLKQLAAHWPTSSYFPMNRLCFGAEDDICFTEDQTVPFC